MSLDTPLPPRVTILCSKIAQEARVEVASYTEKARLSCLTEIELTLATPDFSAIAGQDLLGAQIEIRIETPHMALLLDRASDISGAEVAESERTQTASIRRFFGTVIEVVEETAKPRSHHARRHRHTSDGHARQTGDAPPARAGDGFVAQNQDLDDAHASGGYMGDGYIDDAHVSSGYMGDEYMSHSHGSDGRAPLFIYRLTVRPRLWLLSQRSRLRVCTDISVPEIVESVLKEAGFIKDEDYEFRLNQSYGKREFTIQYNESDLQFICRLTEHWGIGFFFDHCDGKDVVIFTDGDQLWKPGHVPVLPFTSTGERIGIVDLTLCRSRVPGRYILRDYNPDHPTVDWTRSGSIRNGDDGQVIEYCANFESMAEGALLLRARLDALSASRMVFSGQAAEAILEVGTTVRVTGHLAFDRKNLSLTAVELDWKVPVFSGNLSAEFSQHFEAVVAGLNVRPERRTPTPRIEGVVPGIIEVGEDQEYAELDKDGGYRVRLMLDDPEANPQPYAGVRMMQPHGGQGYGFHFPLRPGTEVALSFIDGNPDRPVISGTMPNAQHSSPVQSTTAKSNVIRTGGGNEINFQDSKGNERIKLTSPHGNSLLQIGSPNFPNSGITLDTLGSASERAGIGKSVLSPVLDTTSQLSKSLSRKQKLSSSTDEFESDWKSLLDTPSRVQAAFTNVNAVARQMMDIQENIRGTGKAQIDQYAIRVDQLERQRKVISGKLTALEILRQKAWAKYMLPPAGFLTAEIQKLYQDYFDKESLFRKRVFYYWDAQSPAENDVSKQEATSLLNNAIIARNNLIDAIKNDQRYNELTEMLEYEGGVDDGKGEQAGDIGIHDTLAKKLIEVTSQENLYKIEQDQLQTQYSIDTANVTSMEFAQRKTDTFTGAAASIGQILQTMTMLEALADQRGANVGWNIAPGPFYAPGLLALQTGVPDVTDQQPEDKPSYLSSSSRDIIGLEFNGRNFVQGWNTAQTSVSSQHALTLSSGLRMLQTGKVIAINAWCTSTDYVDPAKGLWEKFKDKMKAEGKAAKALKAVGTVANAPNFLLGFISNPISSAVTAAGMIAGALRKNILPDTPGSPAGTLLMRGENRALLISDRHVEIGAPVVDTTSETTRNFATNDHLMLAGTKERPTSWSMDDANTVFQMAKNGNVMLWSNRKIQFSHSPETINVALEDSKSPADTFASIPPEPMVANDDDNNKMTLSDAGFDFKFNQNSNYTVKSKEMELQLSSEGMKFGQQGTQVNFQKDSGEIKISNNGNFTVEADTIKFSSGENSISIDSSGIKINGQQLDFQSKGQLGLKATGPMEISGQATVAVKGLQMDVQGTAQTSIGSGSAPTMIQGMTVMLG